MFYNIPAKNSVRFLSGMTQKMTDLQEIRADQRLINTLQPEAFFFLRQMLLMRFLIPEEPGIFYTH